MSYFISPYRFISTISYIARTDSLAGKGVPYYTDDTSAPLVYEWKVQCSNTKDCGSVVVATIDGVSRVMEAGTYGTANYERLGQGKESRKNKLYYYSAFDQYIESTSGNDITVDAIDPRKQIHKTVSERKDELKSRKDSVGGMRKSGKLSFQSESTGVSSATVASTSSLTTSSLAVTAAMSTAIDVIHMTPTSNCSSAVPCYDQFRQTYGVYTNCASGCSPTAMTIIYGYYDRIGIFPNLFPGVIASDINIDHTVVNTIRGYMQTNCAKTDGGDGSTTPGMIRQGLQYAQTHGYRNSPLGTYSFGTPASLMPGIITEINGARPLIVNFGTGIVSSGTGHSMVAFGYNSTGNSTTDQVHVNFGWGTYPDKYILISGIIGNPSNPNDSINKLVGAKLSSTVTVPVRN